MDESRTVEVHGQLLPGATGVAVVEMQWRSGWVSHTTEVMQVGAQDQNPEGNERSVVKGDVAAWLDDLQPGVDIVLHDRYDRLGATTMLGWTAADWIPLAVIALMAGTAAHLVWGPTPWRGTRWAWFWLFVIALPLDMVAFLALPGRTPGVPLPRPDGRRMTGGWTFLVALLLGSSPLFQ